MAKSNKGLVATESSEVATVVGGNVTVMDVVQFYVDHCQSTPERLVFDAIKKRFPTVSDDVIMEAAGHISTGNCRDMCKA